MLFGRTFAHNPCCYCRWMRYAPHSATKLKRLKMIQELPAKIWKALIVVAIIIPIGVIIGVSLYFGLNKGV